VNHVIVMVLKVWFWCCICNLWVCINHEDTFYKNENDSFKLCMYIVISGSSFFFELILGCDDESCCSPILILYLVIQGDYLRTCHKLFTQFDGKYPLFVSACTLCVQTCDIVGRPVAYTYYSFSPLSLQYIFRWLLWSELTCYATRL
jgi:hypothetical protein